MDCERRGRKDNFKQPIYTGKKPLKKKKASSFEADEDDGGDEDAMGHRREWPWGDVGARFSFLAQRKSGQSPCTKQQWGGTGSDTNWGGWMGRLTTHTLMSKVLTQRSDFLIREQPNGSSLKYTRALQFVTVYILKQHLVFLPYNFTFQNHSYDS